MGAAGGKKFSVNKDVREDNQRDLTGKKRVSERSVQKFQQEKKSDITPPAYAHGF